jgi:hypothetical protein
MFRIPAVLTTASFLLTVGAVGPTFAQSSTAGGVKVEQNTSVVAENKSVVVGGVNVEQNTSVAVVNLECNECIVGIPAPKQ